MDDPYRKYEELTSWDVSMISDTTSVRKTESTTNASIKITMSDLDDYKHCNPLQPEYQRDFNWDRYRMQGFLHVIISTDMVLPDIVIAYYGSKEMYIVDGKQRLTTISMFMSGKIPYITPDRKKVYYRSLSEGTRRMFKARKIRHLEIRYDISVPRRDMEIDIRRRFRLLQMRQMFSPSDFIRSYTMEPDGTIADYAVRLANDIDDAIGFRKGEYEMKGRLISNNSSDRCRTRYMKDILHYLCYYVLYASKGERLPKDYTNDTVSITDTKKGESWFNRHSGVDIVPYDGLRDIAIDLIRAMVNSDILVTLRMLLPIMVDTYLGNTTVQDVANDSTLWQCQGTTTTGARCKHRSSYTLDNGMRVCGKHK